MFLGSFFESVFVKDGGQSPEMKSVDIPKDKTDLIISREGVFDLLQNLEESKTGGPDYLSSKVLKLFSRIIAPCLTEIFQYSLDSYTIPSIWKVARVIPIYKKGSKELPTNYRPVSLTCITCKLLEHIAFDTVNHRKRSLKLNYYGINENLIFWIEDFLSNRRQFVSVEDANSPFCPINSGVPQGVYHLAPAEQLCLLGIFHLSGKWNFSFKVSSRFRVAISVNRGSRIGQPPLAR
ncbi:uncharacterized protein [Watersipora subatra]|uniref:uncharacterized protein n=1 Tax=Watersipora subatra TaxID=2589382 RepID=UPI00355C1648